MIVRLLGLMSVAGLCLVSLTATAQEVPGWERVANHGMVGHNMDSAEVMSVEQCAAKCDATSGCRGFDYYFNTRQCLPNDADGRTDPDNLNLNNAVDFYQRAMADTHGRPQPPYNPGQPDWRVSDAYCQRYAQTAVEQNQYNEQHQCGYHGRRWTNDIDGHFRWCKSVAPAASKSEQKIRYDSLVACQQRNAGAGGTGNGGPGVASGGADSASTGGGTGGGGLAGSGVCVNGFLAIPGAGITLRNRLVRAGHNEASCRTLCNAESWCISFELSTRGACHLADVNRQSPGIQFNRPANFPWTYYERCGVAGGGPGGGTDPATQPWATQAGNMCFDRWVRDTVSRLNRNQGSDQYNRDKPYGINRYGHFTFRRMTNAFAPDDWNAPEVGANRFAWLWKHNRYEGQWLYFRNSARDPRDRVPYYGLRYFIRECTAGRI